MVLTFQNFIYALAFNIITTDLQIWFLPSSLSTKSWSCQPGFRISRIFLIGNGEKFFVHVGRGREGNVVNEYFFVINKHEGCQG